MIKKYFCSIFLITYFCFILGCNSAEKKIFKSIEFSEPKIALTFDTGDKPDQVWENEFNYIRAFKVDEFGNFYILDPSYKTVKFSYSGKFVRKYNSWILYVSSGYLYKPLGGEYLEINKREYQNWYIIKCDSNDKQIYKINIGNIDRGHRTEKDYENPLATGVEEIINPDGRLHVVDFDRNILTTYDQTGKLIQKNNIPKELVKNNYFLSLKRLPIDAFVSPDGKYLYSVLFKEKKKNKLKIGVFDLNEYKFTREFMLNRDLPERYSFLGVDVDNNLYFSNDHPATRFNMDREKIPFSVFIFNSAGNLIKIKKLIVSGIVGDFMEPVNIDIYGNIYLLQGEPGKPINIIKWQKYN